MKESKLPISESDGFVSVEMSISFYEENIELFSDNEEVKLKSAYRKSKPSTEDLEYKERMKAFIDAKNELLEYQVKMNYKQKIEYK